jgi:integrase
VSAVLAAIDERAPLLFLFLARTGLRISEALATTWGDLDKTADGVVLRVPKSKTHAGVRTVAIPARTARAAPYGDRLPRRRSADLLDADRHAPGRPHHGDTCTGACGVTPRCPVEYLVQSR